MSKFATLIVPTVTIVGLIVLMAMGKIDQAAGLGLIGALSGAHGGAAIANAASVTLTASALPRGSVPVQITADPPAPIVPLPPPAA